MLSGTRLSRKSTHKRKRPVDYETSTLKTVLGDTLNAVVICVSNSWGGLEQVAANDALDLGRLGLKVSVLCLEGSPIHEYLAHSEAINIHPIQGRFRNFFDFKLRAELLRFVENGTNLIHCHQTTLLGSITPWFWNRGDVVLMASRHIMNRHNKKNPFHAAIYRRLDALVVMSQTLRENVLATHSLRERQVKVIHLGLDFDVFSRKKVSPEGQRALWGADPDTVVIGLVGRIDPAKGQATFIKAAAGLMKNPGEFKKLKFVIVGEQTLGSTSKYLEELKGLVGEFGLEDLVVFAGYQESIPEVMRGLDIFVMPSRQEAFGLVSIEAMAMECPIIISGGGSADEIVGEEEFGLLVRPDDGFDLQRQLRYLLENKETREEMGRRGRRHVKKNYDKKVRIQKTLELYERSLRRRGM